MIRGLARTIILYRINFHNRYSYLNERHIPELIILRPPAAHALMLGRGRLGTDCGSSTFNQLSRDLWYRTVVSL